MNQIKHYYHYIKITESRVYDEYTHTENSKQNDDIGSMN